MKPFLLLFLINRMLTLLLRNISPFETLFGKSPDYHFLQVLGCACYPYLRAYNSHKLAFRSKQCVFMGIAPP